MKLVDFVIERGGALEAAQEFATSLASNAPLSIAGAKLVLEALAAGETESRANEIEACIAVAMDSADYREGALAFSEKRQPRFLGR